MACFGSTSLFALDPMFGDAHTLQLAAVFAGIAGLFGARAVARSPDAATSCFLAGS